jgi:Tfp pilus assembly protein PilV
MSAQAGLTLVELVVGVLIFAVAIMSMFGVSANQLTLNEHARYLAWATNDAARVVEQLRKQNSGSGCVAPSAAVPGGFASWDAWLANTGATGGGGKSVVGDELVVVTSSGANPLAVSVAVCWRHRERVLGECTWNGAALAANPSAGGDPAVTESPAMVSTRITCRRT